MRFLDWVDVEQLASDAVEPYGNLLRFACLTGLRQGELFALRERAVDLGRQSIVVEAGARERPTRSDQDERGPAADSPLKRSIAHPPRAAARPRPERAWPRLPHAERRRLAQRQLHGPDLPARSPPGRARATPLPRPPVHLRRPHGRRRPPQAPPSASRPHIDQRHAEYLWPSVPGRLRRRRPGARPPCGDGATRCARSSRPTRQVKAARSSSSLQRTIRSAEPGFPRFASHLPPALANRRGCIWVAREKRPSRAASESPCKFGMELVGLEPTTSWVRSRRSGHGETAWLSHS